MKLLGILASIVFFVALIYTVQAQTATPAAATPAPLSTPVPMVSVPLSALANLSPDAVQAKVNSWLAVGTVIISGITALAGFAFARFGEIVRMVQSAKDELGGRLDRQGGRTDGIQAQLTSVATAVPAPLSLIPPGVTVPADAKQVPKSPALPLILVGLAILGLGLTGCSGTSSLTISPATKATASAVGKATLTAVEDLAAGAAARGAANASTVLLQDGTSTNAADLEAAGSEGLFTQVFSIQTAQDVAKIFNSFTANKTPAVAAQLASAYTAAAPVTQADKVAVVNALATGVINAVSQ